MNTIPLNEIKARLREAYGDRLKGVVLYGSEARGKADTDSDIDILVLLEGPIHLWRDLQTNISSVSPFSEIWPPDQPKAGRHEAL